MKKFFVYVFRGLLAILTPLWKEFFILKPFTLYIYTYVTIFPYHERLLTEKGFMLLHSYCCFRFQYSTPWIGLFFRHPRGSSHPYFCLFGQEELKQFSVMFLDFMLFWSSLISKGAPSCLIICNVSTLGSLSFSFHWVSLTWDETENTEKIMQKLKNKSLVVTFNLNIRIIQWENAISHSIPLCIPIKFEFPLNYSIASVPRISAATFLIFSEDREV